MVLNKSDLGPKTLEPGLVPLLQAVNRLFASQYHLPLNSFLQKIGQIFHLEKAAVYYNRLDYRWQLVASRICEWSTSNGSPKFPDIIEYQEVWPGVETKLSTGEKCLLRKEEIEALGLLNDTDHFFFVFPLFDGKWWNGIFLVDFGSRQPEEEELSLLETLTETLAVAIKRQKRETEYLDITRVFQELLNNIPDLVILTDHQEKWLLVNKKALKLFNFKRHVYQGHTFDEIAHMRPEYKPLLDKLKSLLHKLSTQGGPLQETIKIRQGEKRVWIDFLLIPFRCDAENRILIIGRDITSIKLAQERLLTILENLPVIVYIVHPPTGRILYHNSLFKEYFGEYLIGQEPCFKLLFNRKEVCGFCHLKQAKPSLKEACEIFDETRGRWLRIYESYISWLDTDLVRLGMIQDITEEKQQEENLIRSQKLEVLGRLTGNIAHEFNNILAIVNGYVDLIRQRTKDNTKIQNYISKIQKAVDSGTSLIKQLLVFSRERSTEEKIEDINRLITEQAEVLKKMLGENIELDLKLSSERLPVKLSFEDLQHILTNLVINAKDAMPFGGKLTIKTKRVETSERGPCALLKICDTGQGISPERLAQIFDPFYTTKAPGEGAGLGLTIILSLVRRAGGEIKVESQLGKGTTFEIILPLEIPEALRQGKDILSPESEDQKVWTQKILVVEDEPHIREMLAEMLEGQGFKVAVASNGEEALDWLRKHQYDVDLVITDVVMPKMDGVQLYRLIQKEAPQIKILFISGYAQHVLEKYGFDEENFHILKKPFTFKQLLQEIEKIFTSFL